MIRPNVMPMTEPDPKFLKLMRDLDEERTARKKAEQREARIRGVLKRVVAQHRRRLESSGQTDHRQPLAWISKMALEDKGGLNSSPVGTWELVSFTSHLEDGRGIEPWPNAIGRIVYDSSGHVTGLLISGRRNEADGRSSPPEAQDEFSAYFGIYHVDIAQRIITHDVSASLSATRTSKALRRSFDLNVDKLILGFATTRSGVPMTNRLVWKRISTVPSS